MKLKIWTFTLVLGTTILAAFSCEDKGGESDCTDCPDENRIEAVYAPTGYEFDMPDWLVEPFVPEDNPMTDQGVALGRMLFYDPIMSIDSSQSCFSCHDQSLAFTDGIPKSIGVLGLENRRNSMPLINLGYNQNGFFWDGRSQTLEDQALLPIEDHVELNDTWENVISKLQDHPDYPARFREAFGIELKSEITKELAVKAIAQFERTLISTNSRYDKVITELKGFPTDSEQRGLELFFLEFASPDETHPGCSHCHFNPHFTNNRFANNGLDDVESLEDFKDFGIGGVTGNLFDYGKFRAPTLRNVELTAPYMHDGRFATLEEVLEQYAAGGHGVENEDVNIVPFDLSEEDKTDLINFLKMLTDTTFINNPAFSNPFEG